MNRLLHEERVLVSEMPGTTRDAIDTVLLWHRRRFRIVDTAGMRRPGRVSRGGQVEMVSVAGAKKAIADADVVALVIDASTGASDQDAAIGGEADRAGRGIVDHRQQVGPREEPGRTSRRPSTRTCATGCGFSTTRRFSTSRR